MLLLMNTNSEVTSQASDARDRLLNVQGGLLTQPGIELLVMRKSLEPQYIHILHPAGLYR